MALENKRIDELRFIFSKLLFRSTTQKQRDILTLLITTENFSTTGLVRSVSKESGCAASTVWDAISLFEKLGVVERSRNVVRLTNAGKFLLGKRRDENVDSRRSRR